MGRPKKRQSPRKVQKKAVFKPKKMTQTTKEIRAKKASAKLRKFSKPKRAPKPTTKKKAHSKLKAPRKSKQRGVLQKISKNRKKNASKFGASKARTRKLSSRVNSKARKIKLKTTALQKMRSVPRKARSRKTAPKKAASKRTQTHQKVLKAQKKAVSKKTALQRTKKSKAPTKRAAKKLLKRPRKRLHKKPQPPIAPAPAPLPFTAVPLNLPVALAQAPTSIISYEYRFTPPQPIVAPPEIETAQDLAFEEVTARPPIARPELVPQLETSSSHSRLRQLAEPQLDSSSAEFWAFVDSFLKEQNSAHTRRAYENDLIDFFGYLKARNSPMNVHTLVNYRSLLETRTSERTGQALSRVSINRKIATIKSFLNWLVLNGVMPNNPAKAIKSFRAGRESPTRDISDDMVRRMLELPNRHRVSGRMHHAIMMILFHMGLRRSELVDLKTTDLFEQSGMKVLRVRGKGDKERILPLPEAVAKSIADYLHIARKSLEQNLPLFTAVKNNVTKTYDQPLHPNAVAYIIKIYAAKAGVPYKVSPHSARATAVSNALDHQASHRAVQHMAGWSNPLMVSRYDKRSSDLKNSAVRFVSYDSKKPTEATTEAKPTSQVTKDPKKP